MKDGIPVTNVPYFDPHYIPTSEEQIGESRAYCYGTNISPAICIPEEVVNEHHK